MDDKPLDLSKRSASSNTDSRLLSTEEGQESAEDLRPTPNRRVSHDKNESPESVQNSERVGKKGGLKSRISFLTSKRDSNPKCRDDIVRTSDTSLRKRSDISESSSGKRRKSFDSTSDTINKPNLADIADPKCNEKASEKCISPRPSTSACGSSSSDYLEVQGNFMDSNEKFTFNKTTSSSSTESIEAQNQESGEALPFTNKSSVAYNEKDCISSGSTFICEYCSKSFSFRSQYMIHIRCHTGEKPFECPYCDKRFARKYQLNLHTIQHTGERPFQCEYCDKSFVNASTLKVHTWIHTGEKPYKCPICGREYKSKDSLNYHIKANHPEETNNK